MQSIIHSLRSRPHSSSSSETAVASATPKRTHTHTHTVICVPACVCVCVCVCETERERQRQRERERARSLLLCSTAQSGLQLSQSSLPDRCAETPLPLPPVCLPACLTHRLSPLVAHTPHCLCVYGRMYASVCVCVSH